MSTTILLDNDSSATGRCTTTTAHSALRNPTFRGSHHHNHHHHSTPQQEQQPHAFTPELWHSSYYLHCGICGALSSTCRWPLSPLELIKTRMQVDPIRYGDFRNTFQSILTQHGIRGLYCGLGPTALAYGFQTATKYSLYEMVKDRFHGWLGPEQARDYRSFIYIVSAATAEACADILMCPWEMVRVRIQTSPPGTFPQHLAPALREMIAHRQYYRFPFGSLGPLMARQIPASIANFFTFETVMEIFYTRVFTRPKETYPPTVQLSITAISGFVAGAVCAMVSHPADSLLSHMSSSSSSSTASSSIASRRRSVRDILREVGFYRLATKGLAPRMVLTGSIISMQWFAYHGFRTALFQMGDHP